MKQTLFRNRIGTFVLLIREKLHILRNALFFSERVGTIANDHLATRLVSCLCGDGKTFVDVGAHLGAIVARVKSQTPNCRILAIEAEPSKAEKLKNLFPSIEVHSCAAGESNGEAPFYIDLRRSAFSSLQLRHRADQAYISQIQVAVKRLDDLTLTHAVDVIKIDAEGSELGVLRGSINTLTRCRPLILFESGPVPSGDSENTQELLFQLLESLHYTLVVPNRLAHEGPGLTLEGFQESHFFPRRTTNYFGIPRERRDEFRRRARRVLNILGPADPPSCLPSPELPIEGPQTRADIRTNLMCFGTF